MRKLTVCLSFLSSERGVLKKKHYFLLSYFLLLFVLAPNNLPLFDTFYYWEWSRHLAFSYYDGSPLIAYCIKLSTLVFGDTLFALALVGIVITALTSRILYKTARFFLNEDASYMVMILWLFSPLVTLDLLKQTTYDSPLTLFWALTLYFVVKYIKKPKTSCLYSIGISMGLLLLSKYSGVVLILALMIFLVMTPYRSLFKNKHFYFAMLIAMLIFSPVLYWNYQHEWQSFLYQLTIHQHQANIINQPIMNMFKALFTVMIPSLNFMLLLPLWCWYLSKKKKSVESLPYVDMCISLCLVVCTVFFGFYLWTAKDSALHACWLSQYLITSALLGGYCFQIMNNYRRLFYALIGLYICISLVILSNGFFHIKPSRGTLQYEAIQKLNQRYTDLPKTVVATGWFEARALFFLKDKPRVYTISCNTLQNQYALWSTHLIHDIKHKNINEVLYIDSYDRVGCVKPYFEQCQPLLIDEPSKSHHAIFAYICSNKVI